MNREDMVEGWFASEPCNYKLSEVRAAWSSLKRVVALALVVVCSSSFGGNTPSISVAEHGESKKPLVLTTIKPLTLIAGAVLGAQVDIKQILPDQEIPHHYSLRMSDRRLLDKAQLLLWVGPEMEGFIATLAEARVPSTVIGAAEQPGIIWPVSQESGRDYHLWLNPQNAVAIARALVARVALLEGLDKNLLTRQLEVFEAEIERLEAEISKYLLPLKNKKFIVDHDAFRHFEQRFNLRNSGYLRDGNGQQIGVREMSLLMAQRNIGCVIADPESRTSQLRNVAQTLGATLVIVDPLGSGVGKALPADELSRNLYLSMINEIGRKFYKCLQGA